MRAAVNVLTNKKIVDFYTFIQGLKLQKFKNTYNIQKKKHKMHVLVLNTKVDEINLLFKFYMIQFIKILIHIKIYTIHKILKILIYIFLIF